MRRRRDGQRGSVSVLAATIVVMCGSFGMFLNDAGTALKAATEATNYAAEAGRAAGDALGPSPSGGSIDYSSAIRGANAYLSQVPDVSSKSVSIVCRGVLRVTVTVRRTTPLLGWHVSKTRSQTVHLEVGTSTGESFCNP